jgi:hypothetical protein
MYHTPHLQGTGRLDDRAGGHGRIPLAKGHGSRTGSVACTTGVGGCTAGAGGATAGAGGSAKGAGGGGTVGAVGTVGASRSGSMFPSGTGVTGVPGGLGGSLVGVRASWERALERVTGIWGLLDVEPKS